MDKQHKNERDHLKALERHYLQMTSKEKSSLTIILELLLIEPEKRTLENVLLIKEVLRDMDYFKKLIIGDEFLIVCKNIHLKKLDKGEALFYKGDDSNAAYIVIKGAIDVVLTKNFDENLPKFYLQNVS